MNRLDALKARLAAATTDESRWTDYDIFVRQAREDIERLVAVLDAAFELQRMLHGLKTFPTNLDAALAYWEEPEEQK